MCMSWLPALLQMAEAPAHQISISREQSSGILPPYPVDVKCVQVPVMITNLGGQISTVM